MTPSFQAAIDKFDAENARDPNVEMVQGVPRPRELLHAERLSQWEARLKEWCANATAAEEDGERYDFVVLDQTGFEKHAPKNFAALAASFTEYKS
jgi:hypothetical protein